MDTTMETTETTPLLPSSPPPAPSSSPRNPALILPIYISALSFLYTLPTSIWIKTAPNLDWATGICANLVFNLSIVSAFSLALNVARHRKHPEGPFAFFAFVIDVVIGLFGVTTTTFGFEELGYNPACPSGVIVERCRPVVVDVLLRVGLAVGLVVAFVHALFVFGALIVAVRKLRQGYNTWRFPTGQLTFEFTIKVLRQEDRRDEEALIPQA
ncbi:hypothetical protein PMG11_05383 [Aspergillus terreus]|uniref:Uncharacterized protein n=1 Tax=Aspergillus terreus TaxID=33178 RepID=A0A5M3Z3S4_ASPTE|nr:hypothetical protein ATETN484_0006064200 [Aspergillus terreus]GFF19270.1 hypothetical protein PMG11_05383 [Aspergillus terreus]